MNRLMIAAQTIKETVSALDAAEAMGLEIRHGRCRCPFHGGHDFNCALYKGNRGYFCHVCKRGGDSISFAQEYYGTSFKDTVAWFNDTFHLGMDIESPMEPDALEAAKEQQRRLRAKREITAWADRMRYGRMLTCADCVKSVEGCMERHAPKGPEDGFDGLFRKAADALPEMKEMLAEYEMGCVKNAGEK